MVVSVLLLSLVVRVVFILLLFVFVLCLMFPMASVSLDCPFLIALWFSLTFINSRVLIVRCRIHVIACQVLFLFSINFVSVLHVNISEVRPSLCAISISCASLMWSSCSYLLPTMKSTLYFSLYVLWRIRYSILIYATNVSTHIDMFIAIINFKMLSKRVCTLFYGLYLFQLKTLERYENNYHKMIIQWGIWGCIHLSIIILKYSDFQDKAQLLTQKLLQQDYVAHRLKSSLQI
jgi:hypothetical protein